MFVPTLAFKGKCEEAIDLYKKSFNAEVTRLVPFDKNQEKSGIMDAEIYIHRQNKLDD